MKNRLNFSFAELDEINSNFKNLLNLNGGFEKIPTCQDHKQKVIQFCVDTECKLEKSTICNRCSTAKTNHHTGCQRISFDEVMVHRKLISGYIENRMKNEN